MSTNNAITPFVDQVRKIPGAVALLYNKEKVTYAELAARVNQYSDYFARRRVKKGDRILILQALNIDLYAALIALLGMGCTIVFVEEWTKFRDVRKAQERIGCKFILCEPEAKILCWFYRGLRWLKRLDLEALKGRIGDSGIHVANVSSDDPAIISFSSGTSGSSKAIVRTHGILRAQFEALSPHIRSSRHAMMCTNFSVVTLLNLGLGISTYISSAIKISELGKTDFGELYDEIRANAITHLAFSPYLIQSLARYMDIHDWKPLSVHQVISGGSPVFPSFVRIINSQVKSDIFTVMYGSSEAEPIACCDAGDIVSYEEQEGLFAGSIDDKAKCRIMTFSGDIKKENQPYEAGEIVVTGPHVVKTYLNSEEAFSKNKITLEGEIWHRTGDYGYFDESGNLFLCGNLNYGNMGRHYILDVEKQLHNITGLASGTIIKDTAFIQKHETADETETADKVRALFPFVRKVKFMHIPRDKRHNGKIKYKDLGFRG